MADQKLTELTAIATSELEDLLYMVEDPSGTPASGKISASQMIRNTLGIVSLTDAGTFATALTNVGNNGIVIIDASETLAASTYTVPLGVTLFGKGGVLSLASGTTVTFSGRIEGNVQVFDHSDHANRGTFNWKSPQECNARWWGMLAFDDSGDDATTNRDAFLSAWIASRNQNNDTRGAAIISPPGAYEMIFFDPQITHSDVPFFGHGSYWRLGASQNTQLFEIRDIGGGIKESSVHGMTWDGRRVNNTLTAGTALVVFEGAYNLNIFGCHVLESAADGIRFENSTALNCFGLEADGHDGWGIVVEDYDSAFFWGCTAESCTLGGMKVIGGSTTESVFINGLYCENSTVALRLEGARYVRAEGVSSFDGLTALEIAYDTTNSRPSFGNIVDLTQTEGDVTIEDKCYGNIVYFNPDFDGNQLTDSDGRNRFIPVSVHGDFEIEPTNLFSGSNLVADSNPADDSLTGTMSKVAGNPMLYAAAAHIATTGPAHLQFAPTTTENFNVISGFAAATSTTYYIQVAGECQPNVRWVVQITDSNASPLEYYNWHSEAWETDPGSNKRQLVLTPEDGYPKLFEIPFTTDGTSRTLLIQIIQRTQNSGETSKFYYRGLSTTLRSGFLHRRSSADIGHGNYVEYTDAGRPTASELPEGTQIWNTDDNAWNVTDGTNWRDMQGTTT